ncbi:MAG: type III pantothenate kinase [Spirochaetales bacterium]|nr:type III pantothenate kinase [Spirochaetales bacterium]
MILCLDIGNSQIYGGIFSDDELKFDFHRVTNGAISSDELGLFLTLLLRENGFNPADVTAVAYCSVVPDLNPVLERCCLRYFRTEPFSLQAGVKSGLKIRYSNPHELGSDMIANAIAAVDLYPDRDLLIFDFATATTVCGVNKEGEYLGGALMPGIKITMEALSKRTARLPEVEIMKPRRVCGKSIVDGIQSGLYYGNLGMVKELKSRMRRELYPQSEPVVIATGTYAELYEDEGVFDDLISNLVLLGVHKAFLLNNREGL